MKLLAYLCAVLGLAAILPAMSAEAQHGAPFHHAARVVSHKWHRARHHMRAAAHHARARMHHTAHHVRASMRHHS